MIKTYHADDTHIQVTLVGRKIFKISSNTKNLFKLTKDGWNSSTIIFFAKKLERLLSSVEIIEAHHAWVGWTSADIIRLIKSNKTEIVNDGDIEICSRRKDLGSVSSVVIFKTSNFDKEWWRLTAG